MKIICGKSVVVNLDNPYFKSVSTSHRSKTILAFGDGFYMKFYFTHREGDTYYGDLIEVVGEGKPVNQVFKEVVQ